MFKVRFVLTAYDADEPTSNARFAAFVREEVLPFSPHVGQSIRWPGDRDRKLMAVTWVVDDALFSCTVDDVFTDNLSLDGMDFDELVEYTEGNGWKLIRVYEAMA